MEVVDGVLPGDPAHLPQADDVAFLRFCQGNPPLSVCILDVPADLPRLRIAVGVLRAGRHPIPLRDSRLAGW